MKKYNTIEKKNTRRALRKTMPKAEVLLWNIIRNKKILGLRFLRQYGVKNYIIDFYCPKIRLAIEIDGADHTFTSNAVNKDLVRQKEIEEHGIIFLRFTNDEIYKGIDEVIEKITEFAEQLLLKEKKLNPLNPPFVQKGDVSLTRRVRGFRNCFQAQTNPFLPAIGNRIKKIQKIPHFSKYL